MIKFDIVTLFPEMFKGPFDESIIRRARDAGLVEIEIHNLRNWASDKRKTVDSRPYGGGAGMLMRVDIMYKAITELKKENSRVVLLDTKGPIYSQSDATRLSKYEHIILIAGHYEGLDHRIHEHVADETLSVGSFVLTGGEVPAMIVVDSIVRLVPGVLGNNESLTQESYNEGVSDVEYPQYTRPEEFNGWKVPEVLLSGHHKMIEEWREKK